MGISPIASNQAHDLELYTDKIAALLIRYWGLGKPLKDDEREVLLVALDEENKLLQGPIHVRALKWLKEKGIP